MFIFRFRAQSGLPPDRPLMTYIGRVAHEKNIDFLIQVFTKVRESVPRAMLIIAGLVLLEAMAQGTPVVSTAELGTRSVLKPGSGALIVEEKRDEFAAAVVRVLQDDKLQKDLGERGRAYAKTWSSASMARRLADLYDAIRLAPKPSRVAA
jgi:1,2-diacylglycerol 3-alpha-glucosyltransferase